MRVPIPGEKSTLVDGADTPRGPVWATGRVLDPLTMGKVWAVRLLATALGAALWSLAIAVVLLGPKNPSGLVAVVLCLPAIGVTALALHGWRFLAQYPFGSYGHALKFLAFLGVAMTVVGLVPICFWTGRAALAACGGARI